MTGKTIDSLHTEDSAVAEEANSDEAITAVAKASNELEIDLEEGQNSESCKETMNVDIEHVITIEKKHKHYLSVCGSGLGDPIAYSLLGGGVPYPEHRLNWSLDSVPMFKFLCFPSVMVWSLPFHPSNIQPGSLLSRTSCPYLLSFFPNCLPPPVSVYLADLLQRLVIHRPSVGKLPTLWLPADRCPLLVSCPASHMQVCAPPPELYGWWYLALVWVEGQSP